MEIEKFNQLVAALRRYDPVVGVEVDDDDMEMLHGQFKAVLVTKSGEGIEINVNV